jgi:hypothetical protein
MTDQDRHPEEPRRPDRAPSIPDIGVPGPQRRPEIESPRSPGIPDDGTPAPTERPREPEER